MVVWIPQRWTTTFLWWVSLAVSLHLVKKNSKNKLEDFLKFFFTLMEFQEHCESSRSKKWLLAEQKGQCDSNMCLPIETPDERLDGKLRRRLWDQKRTFHVFSTLTWEFHCCEWTRQTNNQHTYFFMGKFFGKIAQSVVSLLGALKLPIAHSLA